MENITTSANPYIKNRLYRAQQADTAQEQAQEGASQESQHITFQPRLRPKNYPPKITHEELEDYKKLKGINYPTPAYLYMQSSLAYDLTRLHNYEKERMENMRLSKKNTQQSYSKNSSAQNLDHPQRYRQQPTFGRNKSSKQLKLHSQESDFSTDSLKKKQASSNQRWTEQQEQASMQANEANSQQAQKTSQANTELGPSPMSQNDSQMGLSNLPAQSEPTAGLEIKVKCLTEFSGTESLGVDI